MHSPGKHTQSKQQDNMTPTELGKKIKLLRSHIASFRRKEKKKKKNFTVLQPLHFWGVMKSKRTLHIRRKGRSPKWHKENVKLFNFLLSCLKICHFIIPLLQCMASCGRHGLWGEARCVWILCGSPHRTENCGRSLSFSTYTFSIYKNGKT